MNRILKGGMFLVGILFIFAISFTLVSAVTTLNAPAASAVVGGSVIFNVTTTDFATTSSELVNVTFYGRSTLTANSTWSTIGQNNSVNLTTVENISVGIFSTLSLEDANNYIFNVTMNNETNSLVFGEDTSTGITIDNTIPAAATSLTPTSDTDGSVDFSSAVTGVDTTSCTLRFPQINPGAPSYDMTHSGDLCTLTLSSMPENTYTWYVRASDETNTTDSATQTTNIDIRTSAGKAAAGAAASSQKATSGTRKSSDLFSIFDSNGEGGISTGLLILIGIGVVLYFKFKK